MEITDVSHEENLDELERMLIFNKKISEKIKGQMDISLNNFIDSELLVRKLQPFKVLFDLFEPKDDVTDIVQQIDAIENAVNEYLASKIHN